MSGFLCSMVGTTVAAAPAGRTAKTITAGVNAQVDTAQSQFGGASAQFDGTTNTRLTISESVSETGAYTIEFWFRKTANAGDLFYVQTETTGRGVMYIGSTGDLLYDTYSTGTPDFNNTGTAIATGLSNSVWYHIAYVREASLAVKVYVNGTASANTGTSSVDLPTGGIWFGSRGYIGHMDEIRISKTARYTTTFTPSTTPFVNDANTLLLIHADGTDASTTFTDDVGVRAQVGITAVATAQVDTAQSQFGGTSLLLDGDSDYLSVSSSDGTFNFGTSEDFTIECWIRATTVDEYHTVIASNNSSYASSAVTFTGGASAQKLRFNIQGIGNVLIDSTALSANTWYHVAVTRSGSSWNLWRDGTSVSSTTNAGCPVNFEGNGGFNIGWTRWDGAVAYWTGYIDEFRISSIARYTTTFTPSASAFVNDANTLLLIHANGTDGSTSFTDDNA